MTTAAGVAAGAALILSATPASAANPPYSGCPDQAVCLYKDGGGAGSKVIVGSSFTPGTTGIVSLEGVNFLNGSSAINQVSSWKNNTNCQVNFYDAIIPAQHEGYMGSAIGHHYGTTGDWAFTTNNDRLSSLEVVC